MKIVPLDEKLLDEAFEAVKNWVKPSVMDRDQSPVVARRGRNFFAQDGTPDEERRVITALEYAVIYYTEWVRWETAAQRQYDSLPSLQDPIFSLKKAGYNDSAAAAANNYRDLLKEYAICREFLKKSQVGA